MAYSSDGIKSFPNRRKYWEDRRKLSQSCSAEGETRRKSVGATKEDVAISIQDIQHALLGIKICPDCKNDDESKFRPVEIDKDSLRFTECLVCTTLHGADDTMSPQAAKKWIQSLPVKLCPCGNIDKEKYVFQERNGNVLFRCECCMKEFPLTSGDHASVSGATGSQSKTRTAQAFNELQCQCGNTDNEQFNLHIIDDKIKSIQCLKCNVYVSTQSENDYKDVDKGSGQIDQSTSHTEKLSTFNEGSPKLDEELLSSIEAPQKADVTRPKFEPDALKYGESKADQSASEFVEPPPETYIPGKVRQAEIIGKKPIQHARELRMGDHITWWKTDEHYWHHALVKQIHDHSNAITVFHCLDTSPDKAKVRGLISEAFMDLEKESGNLYLLVYDGPCFSPDKSLSRAKQRLGETTYSFFITNEEFVRWCKSDGVVSEQVASILKVGKRHFKTILQGVLGASREIAKATEKASIVKPQSIGLEPIIILIEIAETYCGIDKAKERRKTGDISRGQFINVVIQSSSQVILRGTGTIVGHVVGNAVLPIPYVGGALIGSTLGYYLGQWLGSQTAKEAVKYIEPKDTEDEK